LALDRYHQAHDTRLNRRLREAWIVEAVRTPIGRYGGASPASDRTTWPPRSCAGWWTAGIDPALVEDVILGCANQAGEDNCDVARMALLSWISRRSRWADGQPAVRLRLRRSTRRHTIAVGDGDVFIGGGVSR
jgi:hypothetical protein